MPITYATGAAALLATTALVVGTIEVDANLAARADVTALLARHPRLAIAGLVAEPVTGRLWLRGVTLADGATRVSIDRLSLPLPAAAGAGAWLAAPAAAAESASSGGSSATAENVTIVQGTTTVRIKRIDATGTQLSGAELAALVDPKSPEPLEARLKRLTATAVVVPEILVDDATPGSERHATITQLVLSGAVAGHVVSATTGGVNVAAKDGTGDASGACAGLQVTGLDLPQVARVFGTIRSDDAEPIRPLYDSAVVTGLSLKSLDRKSTFSVATLKETAAAARPLRTDLFTARGRTTPRSDAEKAAAFDDLSHSIRVGSIEIADLASHGDAPDGTTNVSLAGATLHDLAEGKIGGVGLTALRIAAPTATVAVGSAEGGPFVVPWPKGTATPYASGSMLPQAGKADMNRLDIDAVTKDKAGGESHTRFTVAHVGFVGEGVAGDVPTSAKLTFDDIAFDLPDGPGPGRPLIDMGYGHLDISAGIATSYDGGTHELEIHPLSLSGAHMGSLALGLRLSNVTKGIVSSNTEVAKASALSVLVKALTLDVVNDGLVDRAIAWKAKQDGLDVAKEKAFLTDFFADKLPASLGDSANAKIVGTAVAKFVTDPKTLHVSIASQSGLGVGSMALLGDPGLLIDALEVKASADD